jgi:hypothetical protein
MGFMQNILGFDAAGGMIWLFTTYRDENRHKNEFSNSRRPWGREKVPQLKDSCFVYFIVSISLLW